MVVPVAYKVAIAYAGCKAPVDRYGRFTFHSPVSMLLYPRGSSTCRPPSLSWTMDGYAFGKDIRNNKQSLWSDFYFRLTGSYGKVC
ncbi:hypothetical protein VTP01DRAFT_5035, partial [Rhizomucor pusillus]|uniref:uncharacterized protein n=1 Tax=Rhizomucor pusillus TaxID=4840 RepID=UPI0037421815